MMNWVGSPNEEGFGRGNAPGLAWPGLAFSGCQGCEHSGPALLHLFPMANAVMQRL